MIELDGAAAQTSINYGVVAGSGKRVYDLHHDCFHGKSLKMAIQSWPKSSGATEVLDADSLPV